MFRFRLSLDTLLYLMTVFLSVLAQCLLKRFSWVLKFPIWDLSKVKVKPVLFSICLVFLLT